MLDPLGAGAAAAARGVAGDQGAAGDGDPARRLRLRRARSIWSASGWRRCGRGRCGRRSGRAIGRGRCCRSIGREMPTRPRIAGRERRVYALVCVAAVLGRADGALQLRHDGRVVSGGPRPGVRVAGRRSARVRLRQPALGGRAPRAATRSSGTRGSCSCAATTRFHATACTPATPREKGSVEGAVRYLKTRVLAGAALQLAGRARRALRRLARPGRTAAPPRDRPLRRRRAARARARGAAAAAADRASTAAGRRSSRVPLDGYLKLGGCFYRAPRGAGASARRAALRPRPRLDRAPRPDGRALPAQLRARASGCRRRGCAPSRRRSPPADRAAAPGDRRRPSSADYAELCA